MTTTDTVSAELKTTLRRLKLGRLLDTLPERLALARTQKMPHQDFMLLVLSDEVSRRDSAAVETRATRAKLERDSVLERWDETVDVATRALTMLADASNASILVQVLRSRAIALAGLGRQDEARLDQARLIETCVSTGDAAGAAEARDLLPNVPLSA